MSIVQSIPRRPLSSRLASFWGKWLVASPLALAACLIMRAFDPPGTVVTPLEMIVGVAFFSVFSLALGWTIACGADPALREHSSPAHMARALYLIAPGWILANLISYAWAIFILGGVLGFAVFGWRALLH
jgi:hypothetical protein